jgi:hypothetical protein
MNLFIVIGAIIALIIIAFVFRSRFFVGIRKQNNTEKTMMFELIKEWDAFPSPIPRPGRKYVFAGRDDLVEKLKHWIVNSDGGSVLVSGVRGVGKTAFVYFSINQAYLSFKLNQFEYWIWTKKPPSFLQYFLPALQKIWLYFLIKPLVYFLNFFLFKKTPILRFIPINASDLSLNKLENNSEDNIIKVGLLKSMIKNFYYFADDNTKKDFLHVYQMCVSNGWEKIKINLKIELAFYGETITKLLLPLLTLLILFQLKAPNLLPPIINMILPPEKYTSLLLIAVNLSLYFIFHLIKEREINIKFDFGNPDYLSYKFNEVIIKSKDILVFVIDETDKLEASINLNKLIRKIKNTVTITNGRFIFITDDRYSTEVDDTKPKDIGTEENGGAHSYNSTYFNWQIFLPRICVEEIESYINAICINSTYKEKDEKQEIKEIKEKFAYYIFARSEGIFSKIKGNIRDFIVFIGKKPYLSLLKLDKREGQIARLGKLLHQVFNRYDSQKLSDQAINHQQHEILFPILKDIVDNTIPSPLTIESWLTKHVQRGYNDLDISAKKLVQNELIDYLTKIKENASDLPLNLQIPSDVNALFNFAITLSQIKDRVDDLRDKIGEKMEPEKKLEKAILSLQELLENYKTKLDLVSKHQVLSFIDANYLPDYDAAVSLNNSIDPNDPKLKSSSQQEVLERSEKIHLIFQSLEENIVSTISKYIDHLLIDELTTISSEKTDVIINNLPSNFQKLISEDRTTFTKGRQKLILTRVKKLSQFDRMFSLRFLNKPLPYDYSLILLSNQNQQLPQVIKNQNNVSFFNIKELTSIKFLINQVKSYLGIEIDCQIIDDWKAVSREGNGPWRYDEKRLNIPDSYVIKRLVFNFLSNNNYWRFGLKFCNKSEIQPLDDNKHLLIHFYRDPELQKIKYRKYPNKTINPNESNFIEQETSISSTEKISFRLEVQNKDNIFSISLLTNNIEIDNFAVTKDELKSVFMLAWADNNNFELEVKSIVLQTQTIK